MTRVGEGRGQHSKSHPPLRPNPKRKIEKKTSFFDSTMVKVAAISLVVLVLGAGAAYVMQACRFKPSSDPCHYTQYPITTPPLHDVPVISFETYVEGMPHNGVWMLDTDQTHTFGCKITPPIETFPFDECIPGIDSVQETLNQNPSLHPAVFNDQNFNVMGALFQTSNGMLITAGMNPAIRKNYEAALQIIEENVLTETFAHSDIVSIMTQVNAAMIHHLKDHEGIPLPPGGFRNLMATVQSEARAGDASTFTSFLKETLGQEDFDTFSAINSRIFSVKDRLDPVLTNPQLDPSKVAELRMAISKHQHQVFKAFTPEERKIWETVFYTAPFPEELPALMEQFAHQYRAVLRGDIHPISRAAWVHMQLVNIHPYFDANGRLARAIMNAELKRGGYAPIVFFDDEAYDQAVQEDQKSPGAFTEFLCRAYDVSLPMNDVPEMPQLIDAYDQS